jgi:hypothetical protein
MKRAKKGGAVATKNSVAKNITAKEVASWSREEWASATKELLRMERESEVELVQTQLRTLSASACQAAGVSLLHLVLEGNSLDTFGHTVLTFTHRTRPELPSHKFTTGDVVQLTLGGSSEGADGAKNDNIEFGGIISKVKDESLSLSVDDFEEKCGNQSVGSVLDGLRNWRAVRLDLLPNDASYRKTERAVDDMVKSRGNGLVDVLFGARPPRFDAPVVNFSPFNVNLNECQQKAVMSALEARDISLIHGPPGTGKTTTVVELIRQAVLRGKRVLLTASSNIAVDNVLEKLSAPVVSFALAYCPPSLPSRISSIFIQSPPPHRFISQHVTLSHHGAVEIAAASQAQGSHGCSKASA